MDYSELKRILREHELRITDCRVDVLSAFVTSGHAMSTKELESSFSKYDRVTLYRTLHSFVEKGILHSIPDDSGFARYGVCHETCDPENHKHDHIHFKCEKCGNIECLPRHHAPAVRVPGYIINDVNLIINGICADCNSGN